MTISVACFNFWNWCALHAHWVNSRISNINVIICAGVLLSDAAVVWTVLGQGDIATGAGAVFVRADIATFILSMWVTLLGALPLVLA